MIKITLTLISLLLFHFSQAENIYSPNNIDSSFSPQPHTYIDNWLGISDDTSKGSPYLTRISTKNVYTAEGYVANGEISIILYQGSIHILNDIGGGRLEKKGEKYWTAPNEFIRFNMTENTIVYILFPMKVFAAKRPRVNFLINFGIDART